MKCIEEIIIALRESHNLYEMANVSKQDTGLPYDIWVDSAGKDRRVSHGPRIKVAVNGKSRRMPEISISDNPELKAGRPFEGMNVVIKWVQKYKDVLLKHYNKELTDKQLLNLLND